MSITGLGPHTPKPGYRMRWIKQGAALVFRAPSAFVSLMLLSSLLIVPALLAGAILALLTGMPIIEAGWIVRIIAGASVTIALMIYLAMLMREDIDVEVDWAHLRSAGKDSAVMIMALMSLVFALQMLLFGGTDRDTTAAASSIAETGATASAGVTLLLGWLTLMVMAMTDALQAQVIYGPLVFATIIGARLDLKSARAFDRVMLMRHAFLHFECFLMVFGLGALAKFMGPFGFIPLFLALGWSYVAAREIAGGISSNGKRAAAQSKNARHAALPQGT